MSSWSPTKHHIIIPCLNCKQPYSHQRQPRVLPCGHSLCSFCVFEDSDRNGYYYCYQCHGRFDVQQSPPPINTLFFHMLDKMQQFARIREWQSGGGKDQGDLIDGRLSLLTIQQQCLYTFCQRKKYERDGVYQMFCSQQCKLNHEELQKM